MYDAHTPEQQSRYLSFRAWDKVVRQPFTEPPWAHLLNNKWFFSHNFRSVGLPVAQPMGVVHPVGGHALLGHSLRSPEEFLRWVLDTQVTSFVMKPVAGWSTEGVLVVDEVVLTGVAEPVFQMADGSLRNVADMFASFKRIRQTNGYLIEERLQRQFGLSDIGLGFPHAIRIVTATPPLREPEIVMAVAYVGRQGQMANSWQLGAISVDIDTATGEMGYGRTLPRYGLERLTSHPDDATAFTGKVIPQWREAVGISTHAARVTPGCQVVCWEIILSEKGPHLLEANLGFGISMFQVHTEGFSKHRFGEVLRELGGDMPDGSGAWVRRNSPPSTSTRVLRAARRRLSRWTRVGQ